MVQMVQIVQMVPIVQMVQIDQMDQMVQMVQHRQPNLWRASSATTSGPIAKAVPPLVGFVEHRPELRPARKVDKRPKFIVGNIIVLSKWQFGHRHGWILRRSLILVVGTAHIVFNII
jgi:hypothetical protein